MGRGGRFQVGTLDVFDVGIGLLGAVEFLWFGHCKGHFSRPTRCVDTGQHGHHHLGFAPVSTFIGVFNIV